jgi:hypothetical protein
MKGAANMTRIRVSVEENFGNHEDEIGEEAQWGPYVTSIEIDKPFAALVPTDIVDGTGGANIEDVIYDDRYLMFDVWADLSSEVEPGAYCRYNFLVIEEVN